MKLFLLTFGLFLVAITGMSIGVLMGRARLKGSCGGVDREGKPLGDCLCSREKRAVCAETGGLGASPVTIDVPAVPSRSERRDPARSR